MLPREGIRQEQSLRAATAAAAEKNVLGGDMQASKMSGLLSLWPSHGGLVRPCPQKITILFVTRSAKAEVLKNPDPGARCSWLGGTMGPYAIPKSQSGFKPPSKPL